MFDTRAYLKEQAVRAEREAEARKERLNAILSPFIGFAFVACLFLVWWVK